MILTSPLKSSWNWYQLNDLWRLHIFWLKTCETKTKCSTMDFTTQSPSSVDLSILLESGIWQKVWKIWKNFWNLADYQTNFFQTIFDPSLTKILCQKYISRRDSFVGLRVPNNCIILKLLVSFQYEAITFCVDSFDNLQQLSNYQLFQ